MRCPKALTIDKKSAHHDRQVLGVGVWLAADAVHRVVRPRAVDAVVVPQAEQGFGYGRVTTHGKKALLTAINASGDDGEANA